ncbi:MSC_0619 family F1-like ATPase alpha subunit [Mycoplasma sp. Ms02]|uniref:MSC_0619 family F1-like ATPase alpha subunit n=1 Tax=Mycoplasma sp. Ms02 TaxID=353851 RepID=UPI001C8ACE7A|nr:ATP F0F1 synthase subunit alpha [Mycoplasma sp. Ms02]QZE12327.1 ATP F0F1 synthase subunit alpha [Mycoplasma sp. Ms02]
MSQKNKVVVSAIFDYIIEADGKFNYQQNQNFELVSDASVKLVLISASQDRAYFLTNATGDKLSIGAEIVPSTKQDTVYTSLEHFGKILDIHGNVLYPAGKQQSVKYLEQTSLPFNKPNFLMDYQPLKEQLKTGYVLVDMFTPIGKGQRQLILGDRKTGKSFIALNAIINQKGENVKCIYVSIGQQHTQVSEVYDFLKKHDALDYTMIVSAPANNPYTQFLAPYIGMAHAENLSKDHDVLIVFDDLTNHANIYREIALLTNKSVGKEAFPGDMFFAHSRLLERSGKFKNRKTITALPILQTVENDITSLVASNVISITDGQLVTNTDIFANGKLPAIDVELSVSRIGGQVTKPYMSRPIREIGKLYKSFKKQTKLASLKYDLNEETNTLIRNGLLIEGMFTQKGASYYHEHTMFMTSKLITWNILKDVNNIALALKFIDALIQVDPVSKNAYELMMNNQEVDDEAVGAYFAFVTKQFAQEFNLDWNITTTRDFVKLSKENMAKIVSLIEEK